MRAQVRFAGVVMLLVALGAAGCGKSAQRNPDGGDGPRPDVATSGLRAFDVVAVLSRPEGGAPSLPQTNNFTLVVDLEGAQVIAGANGSGAVVPVTTADGRTLRSAGPFVVGDANPGACALPEGFIYESFEVTIAGGTLTGTARGSATISCGDCLTTLPFVATLTGTDDKTAPTLRGGATLPLTPFDAFGFGASEPLPTTATARLVADDGAAIDLIPQVTAGEVPFVTGFSKPDVVLRAGQGYVVTLDGLVDFAGLSDEDGLPLRLTTFVDSPTVSEDGFESASDSTLGGAMVMTAGALPAIAGATSLYIGTPGAPGLDASNGRSLSIRLARQAGDTKVRFSYRVVAPQAATQFSAMVRVGSEGASPGGAIYGIGGASNPTEMLTVAGKTAFASVAAQMEMPLPADATDTVLFVIVPTTMIFCSPGGSPKIGLLIDDVRLE